MAKRKKGKKAEKSIRKKTKKNEEAKTAEKQSAIPKPKDDKAIVKTPSDLEHLLEQTEGTQTDKPANGSKEVDGEKSDIEIPIGKVVDLQKDDQEDGVTEAILEAAAETERRAEGSEGLRTEDTDAVRSPNQKEEGIQTDKLTDDTQKDSQAGEAIEVAEEAEKCEEEVESVQAEGKLTGIVVEVKDSDTTESLSQERGETQTEKPVDDVSESVAEESFASENPTEKNEDTKTDDHPGQVIDITADAEETVIGDSVAESQTVVNRIKKFVSGIFPFGSKSDDSIEEGSESPETVANYIEKADDTQADNQEASTTEDNIERTDDEIQTVVFSDKKPYRTRKTGSIISFFIIIAAVILLFVASLERRSAKKALVQINKVAESLKQMQEETLKDREQITHSQIESGELVIDALSLTRNSLELESANTDELKVKKIIDVFINDIDERITKIKGDITLLRNKLKEAN